MKSIVRRPLVAFALGLALVGRRARRERGLGAAGCDSGNRRHSTRASRGTEPSISWARPLLARRTRRASPGTRRDRQGRRDPRATRALPGRKGLRVRKERRETPARPEPQALPARQALPAPRGIREIPARPELQALPAPQAPPAPRGTREIPAIQARRGRPVRTELPVPRGHRRHRPARAAGTARACRRRREPDQPERALQDHRHRRRDPAEGTRRHGQDRPGRSQREGAPLRRHPRS